MLNRLTLISLLILFLPFFQTCSDKNISENTILKNSPLEEEVKSFDEAELKFNLTFEELTAKKQKAIKKFIALKNDLTVNGYEIGFLFLQDIQNPQWIILPFTILIVLSFASIILSFKRKIKAVFILSIINICLLISPFVMLYFGKIFEDIDQLKIGFYMLFFNLLIITYRSRLDLKTKTAGNSAQAIIAGFQ